MYGIPTAPETRTTRAFSHGQPQRLVEVSKAQLAYNEHADRLLQSLAHGRLTREQYTDAIEYVRGIYGVSSVERTIV